MSQIITTPFELGTEKRIPEVMATVNGIEVKLAVDIGAGEVIISRPLAESLNLEYTGDRREVSGVGTAPVTMDFGRVNLNLAGKEFVDLNVGVMDMALLGEVQGVIGFELLKDFRIVLDYRNQVFSLEESEEDAENDPLMEPLEFMLRHLTKLPATVNGEKMSFILDSGASYNCISKSTMDRLGWEYQSPDDPTKQAEGFGGKVQTWGFLLDKITVWDTEVDTSDHPTLVINLPANFEDGILGFPILKDKKLIIDYPARRIALKTL